MCSHRVLALLSAFCAISMASAQLGKLCTSSAVERTCVLPENCPELRDAQVQLEMCGYAQGKSLVCCDLTVPFYPKSSEKCGEYQMSVSRILIDNRQNTDRGYDDAKPVRDDTQCESRNIQFVNIINTSTKEFPHLVYLAYDNNMSTPYFHCDGSLISQRFVLTSAYCVKMERKGGDGQTYSVNFVKTGEHYNNVDMKLTYHDRIRVQDRIAHPDYKSDSHHHNVGLLNLEKDVPLSIFVMPICLPQQRALPANQGYVDSIKLEKNRRASEKFSLHDQSLVYTSHIAKCSELYADQLKPKFDDKTMFCAVGSNRNPDIYHLDIGGPLQIDNAMNPCMKTLAGVASHVAGRGVREISYPQIYTNIFDYVPWIEKIVWDTEE